MQSFFVNWFHTEAESKEKAMQVQVNTDNHIPGDERLHDYAQELIEGTLARFQDRVTSVKVHLGDESGAEKRADDDKRCSIEARIAGHQPVAVTNHAPTVREAITGAVHKLEKILNTLTDREQDKRRG
jgi:ribosomal subunit interface protein